jgi:hypothetical protein
MSDHTLCSSSESGEDLSVFVELPEVTLDGSAWITEITVPDEDE